MKLLSILLPFALLASVGAQGDDSRPNILFAFADDWGRYASAYAKLDGPGTVNDIISTPNFDRVANEGVLFRRAYVNAPSCTPCRSSLLSGQAFFRTGRASILQGAEWNPEIPSYPLLLRDAGYHIGQTWKVWSPGTPVDAPYGGKETGYESAGSSFNGFSQTATKLQAEGVSAEDAMNRLFGQVRGNFDAFLKDREEGQPFCYWFGPTNVHRKWIAGSGHQLWDLNPDDLEGKMPPFLPDVPVVREDFADYLGEAMAFDAALGILLEMLEATGELDNTVIVVSGDHGAPGFPRGKCNLYDFGTEVPLAIRWGNEVKAGRVVEDLVSLPDLAPTFLEVAGEEIPDVMTAKSLVPVLESEESGQIDPDRDWVIHGRERHVAVARAGKVPYPQRAIRTHDFLYIVNFRPDRWPMGDPLAVTTDDAPSFDELANNTTIAFGDLDASPTKAWMVAHRNYPQWREVWDLGFGKRPEEELYILADDPHQINNVASEPEFDVIRKELRAQLMSELNRLGDPRLVDDGAMFENSPFAGE